MSCKNRNGVMLVNIFFKIFSQFFKIRAECPFKTTIRKKLSFQKEWTRTQEKSDCTIKIVILAFMFSANNKVGTETWFL